ncbi:ADYC domain-containing protein [Nannocystis bainbridge]|uniref:ADYC domain-containing protein n=1 Tax=Nannocystis bainbridge TaxID=2995303 RepID=A0ABT5E3Q0_9BACT|nr:ADYC domain-containing protein [Nannocystis bainbridge]MDC0720499.1 ADYC domain-containing protein [Nannocystis bainbridge]
MSLFIVDFRHVPLALLALTVACTEIPGEDDLQFRTTNDTTPLNSPDINHAPVPEVALDGQENFAGVTLVGLRHLETSSQIFQLDTIDDALVARDGSSIIASGSDLLGWELVMERDGHELIATISGYSDDIEALADDGEPLTAYALSYHGLKDGVWGQWNECPEFAASPDSPVLTLIRGQTYDREDRRVDLIDPDWVTFACLGEAAFKAKSLGYSQSRIFPGTSAPATRAQQDATLKMITADYCGTGHSFTEQGVAIDWQNRAASVTPAATPGDLEAVWGPDGALCLEEPRLRPRQDVEAECTIPSCAGFDFTGAWEWKSFHKP